MRHAPRAGLLDDELRNALRIFLRASTREWPGRPFFVSVITMCASMASLVERARERVGAVSPGTSSRLTSIWATGSYTGARAGSVDPLADLDARRFGRSGSSIVPAPTPRARTTDAGGGPNCGSEKREHREPRGRFRALLFVGLPVRERDFLVWRMRSQTGAGHRGRAVEK